MGKDGLVIVYTGNGKGKTTAALGIALRAVGHNYKICMIQFIKGSWHYGEMTSSKRLEPEFELTAIGGGFVGIIDDKISIEKHKKIAGKARRCFRYDKNQTTTSEFSTYRKLCKRGNYKSCRSCYRDERD